MSTFLVLVGFVGGILCGLSDEIGKPLWCIGLGIGLFAIVVA